MAEDEVPVPDPDDDAELDASEIVTDDKGNKTVSLSTMLRYKKDAKANAKRLKELEPIAARVTDVEGKLESASPIINAILSNPQLKAAALRAANGTRPSADSTDQPDDPDLLAYAEDMGFYLADGATPDTARAQRVLARIDARNGRQTDAKMRPLAGITLGHKAEANILKAINDTDENGVPIATEASIREVVQQMGPDGQHLLANPQVIELVLDRAMGLDRRAKRTPKAPDEPLYSAGAGGSRRRHEPAVSADDREIAKRIGLKLEYLEGAAKKLAAGGPMRAGKE